jgi:hypothetical protein
MIRLRVERSVRPEVLVENDRRAVFAALTKIIDDDQIPDGWPPAPVGVQHGPTRADEAAYRDAARPHHRCEQRVDLPPRVESTAASPDTSPCVPEHEAAPQMTATGPRAAVRPEQKVATSLACRHHGDVLKSKSPRNASQKRSRSIDDPGISSDASVAVTRARPRTCSVTPRPW